MSRESRKALISSLESSRNSKVITYIVGDRAIQPALIAPDAMRPLFEHLDAMGGGKKIDRPIDLFLYSRGGALEVPWPMINVLREYADELHVMIPFRAHSAATMLTLGADKIFMGQKAELGPIDPQMTIQDLQGPIPRHKTFGVEDVTSYVSFIRDRGGIGDQAGLSSLLSILATSIDPVTLGQVYRVYSHIRLVGRKLLSLHRPALGEGKVASLIDSLTEKLFIHGHAIGRKEAKDMGLDVSELNEQDENLAWKLLVEYEELMKLRESADMEGYFTDDAIDTYEESDAVLAALESVSRADVFQGKLRLTRIRKLPPQITLQIQLQPQITTPTLQPAQFQQLVQQISQAALAQVLKQLEQQMRAQAPVEGINRKLLGAKWTQLAD